MEIGVKTRKNGLEFIIYKNAFCKYTLGKEDKTIKNTNICFLSYILEKYMGKNPCYYLCESSEFKDKDSYEINVERLKITIKCNKMDYKEKKMYFSCKVLFEGAKSELEELIKKKNYFQKMVLRRYYSELFGVPIK